MGDGPGRSPEPAGRRLGYRPPPRGWPLRLLILLLSVVLTAVMLKGVADLMVSYAGQAREIGRATTAAHGAPDG